jgi:hypothetical protein
MEVVGGYRESIVTTMKKNCMAVVSANMGGYDTVKPVPRYEPGIDYFYISDRDDVLTEAALQGWMPLKCDWSSIEVPVWANHAPDRYRAKVIKLAPWAFPQEKYRHYLWIDSSITLLDGWWQSALNHLGSHDILLHSHRNRNSVYEEAAFSMRMPKYEEEQNSLASALEQMATVLTIPLISQLYETGFILRRHTARQDDLARIWWQAQETYRTTQDQVTFCIALWEAQMDVAVFPFTLPNVGRQSQILALDDHKETVRNGTDSNKNNITLREEHNHTSKEGL